MTAPSYTSWHVGMKVVCIDNGRAGEPGIWLSEAERPQIGEVYTVSRVFIDLLDKVCVDLEEICRDPQASAFYGTHVGYGAFRFRPVQTRQTDISIFTAMLSPKHSKAGKVRA